jgi:hypothetical protein
LAIYEYYYIVIVSLSPYFLTDNIQTQGILGAQVARVMDFEKELPGCVYPRVPEVRLWRPVALEST